MQQPGLTIQEISTEKNRAEGMRSFSISHVTRDTVRSIVVTCHGTENVATWQDHQPEFVGDAETLVRNLDLAHLLSAFTTQLLHLANLTQLGNAPIHLGC